MPVRIVRALHLAELRRVALPRHRVAPRPVAVGAGADVERHPQSVAHVEARAAHLRELPPGPEIPRAPLGVRLEAAAGEHHRAAAEVSRLAFTLGAHAQHPLPVVDQGYRTRVVEDLDAFLHHGSRQVLYQARPAAVDHQWKASEELAPAVDDGRLGAVVRHEFHPLPPQPNHALEALRDQRFAELGIRAIAGDAVEVVVKLLDRVAIPVGVLRLVVGNLGELLQILHRTVGEAHDTARETAVAPRLVDRRGFEHRDAGASVSRRERRAQRGIAFADDENVDGIRFVRTHVSTPFYRRSSSRFLPPPLLFYLPT